MEEILLIGGGGHCKACIDVIEQENKYTIAGIIDQEQFVGTEVLGYKIIGSDDDLAKLFEKYKYALITLGHLQSNTIRVKLYNKLKEIGYILPSIISPISYVSKHSSVGEGTIVMHQALINADVKVGKNCIINSKALIEHDAYIGDHCHISTSSVVNGGVKIKENTFFGSNATSKQYIEIEGFVKAGSLVK